MRVETFRAETALSGKNVVLNRREAIAVRLEDKKSFAYVVGRIKKGVWEETKNLERINQTRDGNILLEFSPSVGMAEFFSSVKSVLEKEHKATKFQPLADVELRDIDFMATKGNVVGTFQRIAMKSDCIEFKKTGLLEM